MSFREHFIIDGADCSVRGCDAAVEFPEGRAMYSLEARRKLELILKAAGWSAWAGRSLRLYCPAHAPGTRHTMRRLW